MPFTISHAAAVLPFGKLLRRWKLLSAAVIGSMVPDFGVFAPNLFARYETHGIRALFEFCLPVGLASYWIFQRHIKPATLQLMPDRLFELWCDEATTAPILDVRQWILASTGIVLGAISHLIWDGFTHENARGVRYLSIFDGVAITFAGHTFTWYGFLQHASSVVCLSFVLWFVWRGVWAQPDHPGHTRRLLSRHERHRWLLAYVVVAIVTAVFGSLAAFRFNTDWRLVHVLKISATASLWGIVISLLVVSAFLRVQLRKQAVMS